MGKWFKIVLANALILIVLVGGLGVLGLYLYNRNKYITTDDARVAANTVNITALAAGKIVVWDVKPGDTVSDNSTIGSVQVMASAAPTAGAAKPALSTGVVPKTAVKPTVKTPATPTAVPIKAPIGGTIIQNIAEAGQTVMVGQPLAMMADLSKVYIEANIEETRIADVKPNQDVDITVDAFPGEKFSGHVLSFTRATASTFSLIPTTTTSGSYTKVMQKIPVQISIDTAGKDVLPGMSASVRIQK